MVKDVRTSTEIADANSVLDGNIDGLVHLSDLSWNQSEEEAVKSFSKGQEVEAVILGIDPHKERISLGIKQLSEDVFDVYSKHAHA